MIDNKFPGKDITSEDLKTKFPLCAKKNSKHKSVVNVGGIKIGDKKNVVIFAGPNMVESYSLMSSVAKKMLKKKLIFLRGGAFKPLTFPYRSKKYCETREEGLEFLKYVRKKYNCKVISEIMESKFLDKIEEFIDIIQIGAEIRKLPFFG